MQQRYSDDTGCDFEQETAIAEQASRGIQYLQENGAGFERLAFELDEDGGECKIAGTLDNFRKVREGLGRRMPRLMLLEIDLREVTPKTELYLPGVEVFGFVDDLDETAEVCTLQVTAVGLDEGGEETSLRELIKKKRSLAEIKNIWQSLDQGEKVVHLTNVLTKQTSWQIFKVSMGPHDYASDVEDIINPDLLGLIYDDKETFESLCNEPREDFPLKYVPGPPGCGKTTFMLNYMQARDDKRFAVVAHSNLNEQEVADRMRKKRRLLHLEENILPRSIVGRERSSSFLDSHATKRHGRTHAP